MFCSVLGLHSNEIIHFCLKLPRLNTVFCCLSLHTGAVILGIIGTLWSFYRFSLNLWMVLSVKDELFENPYQIDSLLYWNVLTESVMVLTQLLLLLGIFINNQKYLLPMLWIEGVLIILGYFTALVFLVMDPYLSLIFFNVSKYHSRCLYVAIHSPSNKPGILWYGYGFLVHHFDVCNWWYDLYQLSDNLANISCI